MFLSFIFIFLELNNLCLKPCPPPPQELIRKMLAHCIVWIPESIIAKFNQKSLGKFFLPTFQIPLAVTAQIQARYYKEINLLKC